MYLTVTMKIVTAITMSKEKDCITVQSFFMEGKDEFTKGSDDFVKLY